MRAAAVAAGPAATVPTCPEWTVAQLVRHMARVHRWAGTAVLTDPADEAPVVVETPADWDELLAYWDEHRAALTSRLRDRGPDAPAWAFVPAVSNVGFWARRQAHETAIHRLDAEHAVAGGDPLDTLMFDPELAADGIDEALRRMIPRRLSRDPATATGTVLFHAADAGASWLVHLRAAEGLAVGPAENPAIDADASVVGTADAVYRAIWHRPSNAVLGGDLGLIAALRTP